MKKNNSTAQNVINTKKFNPVNVNLPGGRAVAPSIGRPTIPTTGSSRNMTLIGTPKLKTKPATKTTVKVTAPAPINLPSRKSENLGQDPNIALVPSGSAVWGTGRQSDETIIQSEQIIQEKTVKTDDMAAIVSTSPPSAWGAVKIPHMQQQQQQQQSQPQMIPNNYTQDSDFDSNMMSRRGQGFHLQRDDFPTLGKRNDGMGTSPPESQSMATSFDEREKYGASGLSLRPTYQGPPHGGPDWQTRRDEREFRNSRRDEFVRYPEHQQPYDRRSPVEGYSRRPHFEQHYREDSERTGYYPQRESMNGPPPNRFDYGNQPRQLYGYQNGPSTNNVYHDRPTDSAYYNRGPPSRPQNFPYQPTAIYTREEFSKASYSEASKSSYPVTGENRRDMTRVTEYEGSFMGGNVGNLTWADAEAEEQMDYSKPLIFEDTRQEEEQRKKSDTERAKILEEERRQREEKLKEEQRHREQRLKEEEEKRKREEEQQKLREERRLQEEEEERRHREEERIREERLQEERRSPDDVYKRDSYRPQQRSSQDFRRSEYDYSRKSVVERMEQRRLEDERRDAEQRARALAKKEELERRLGIPEKPEHREEMKEIRIKQREHTEPPKAILKPEPGHQPIAIERRPERIEVRPQPPPQQPDQLPKSEPEVKSAVVEQSTYERVQRPSKEYKSEDRRSTERQPSTEYKPRRERAPTEKPRKPKYEPKQPKFVPKYKVKETKSEEQSPQTSQESLPVVPPIVHTETPPEPEAKPPAETKETIPATITVVFPEETPTTITSEPFIPHKEGRPPRDTRPPRLRKQQQQPTRVYAVKEKSQEDLTSQPQGRETETKLRRSTERPARGRGRGMSSQPGRVMYIPKSTSSEIAESKPEQTETKSEEPAKETPPPASIAATAPTVETVKWPEYTTKEEHTDSDDAESEEEQSEEKEAFTSTINAPLQPGIVYIENQPGIDQSDTTPFIEIKSRSKRKDKQDKKDKPKKQKGKKTETSETDDKSKGSKSQKATKKAAVPSSSSVQAPVQPKTSEPKAEAPKTTPSTQPVVPAWTKPLIVPPRISLTQIQMEEALKVNIPSEPIPVEESPKPEVPRKDTRDSKPQKPPKNKRKDTQEEQRTDAAKVDKERSRRGKPDRPIYQVKKQASTEDSPTVITQATTQDVNSSKSTSLATSQTTPSSADTQPPLNIKVSVAYEKKPIAPPTAVARKTEKKVETPVPDMPELSRSVMPMNVIPGARGRGVAPPSNTFITRPMIASPAEEYIPSDYDLLSNGPAPHMWTAIGPPTLPQPQIPQMETFFPPNDRGYPMFPPGMQFVYPFAPLPLGIPFNNPPFIPGPPPSTNTNIAQPNRMDTRKSSSNPPMLFEPQAPAKYNPPSLRAQDDLSSTWSAVGPSLAPTALPSATTTSSSSSESVISLAEYQQSQKAKRQHQQLSNASAAPKPIQRPSPSIAERANSNSNQPSTSPRSSAPNSKNSERNHKPRPDKQERYTPSRTTPPPRREERTRSPTQSSRKPQMVYVKKDNSKEAI